MMDWGTPDLSLWQMGENSNPKPQPIVSLQVIKGPVNAPDPTPGLSQGPCSLPLAQQPGPQPFQPHPRTLPIPPRTLLCYPFPVLPYSQGAQCWVLIPQAEPKALGLGGGGGKEMAVQATQRGRIIFSYSLVAPPPPWQLRPVSPTSSWADAYSCCLGMPIQHQALSAHFCPQPPVGPDVGFPRALPVPLTPDPSAFLDEQSGANAR